MANKYSNIQIVGQDTDSVKIILDERQWTKDELRGLAAYTINGGTKIHFANIKDVAMCITAESLKPEVQRQKFRILVCVHSFRSEEVAVH